jgi:hypothetical protein
MSAAEGTAAPKRPDLNKDCFSWLYRANYYLSLIARCIDDMHDSPMRGGVMSTPNYEDLLWPLEGISRCQCRVIHQP